MVSKTGSTIRMLVVDDDGDIAQSVGRLLVRRFRAAVEIAGDVHEAKEKLHEGPFDLVILDYQLPDGTGLQLLKEIAESKEHPPVIMVTGQGDESVASEALRLRASGYVVKDDRLPALLPETVSGVLNEIALKRAEEKLRQSEENERALLNATLQALMLLDSSGIVLAANETAASRLGLTSAEIIGRNFFELLPQALASERMKRMQEVFRTGEPARFEDERDGMYLELNIYPVFNEDGKVERVAFFAQDMTERKKAEDAIKKARDELEERVRERTAQLVDTNRELRAEIAVRQRVEESLKTLSAQVHGQARMLDQILSSSPDRFYLYDARGKFMYASAPAAELLGLKQVEVEGKYWWDLGLPDQAMRPLEIQRETVMRTGETRAGRIQIPTVAGDGDFDYILSPIINWNGKVTAVLATVREVTEEELDIDELERHAVELEEKARLMDLLPFAVMSRDMNDRIGLWNAGAERLYGFTTDEAAGKAAHELLETEFPSPPGEINFELISNGTWEGLLVNIARDGRKVTVRSRWTVEIDDAGRPGAILQVDEAHAPE